MTCFSKCFLLLLKAAVGYLLYTNQKFVLPLILRVKLLLKLMAIQKLMATQTFKKTYLVKGRFSFGNFTKRKPSLYQVSFFYADNHFE